MYAHSVLIVALAILPTSIGSAQDGEATGAGVIVQYGSEVSASDLQALTGNVEEGGCPVTAIERYTSPRINIAVGSERADFRDPDAAAAWALDLCTTATLLPVTFQFGLEISPSGMASVVRGVEMRGCPVEVSDDGLPLTVTVRVLDQIVMFDEPLYAGGWAIDRCVVFSDE